MLTSCSDCGYGNGSSSVASTTVKIAVVAPMPKAMVSTAIAVKPGDFRNMRTPKRRSCQSSSNIKCRFCFWARLDTNSLGVFIIAHEGPELDRCGWRGGLEENRQRAQRRSEQSMLRQTRLDRAGLPYKAGCPLIA